MKDVIMETLVVLYLFVWFLVILPLMLVVFIPVLPIMLLAFPMQFLNEGENKIHWSQKPYLWYFKNVWIRIITPITNRI